MADDNLLATLEGSLRQTRATRARLHARLLEIELEAEKLRTEIGEMDQIAGQTEAAMFRIMSSVLSRESAASSNSNYNSANNYNRRSPSDREIEAALREDQARAASEKEYADARAAAARPPNVPATSPASMPSVATSITRSAPAPSRHEAEAQDERFLDRTIPQAAALLLRESSVPLHVNEIYTKLCEGGFQFTGQNPTISIAVSLNRNRRFRKVAPGTFDLMIRDAAQAS